MNPIQHERTTPVAHIALFIAGCAVGAAAIAGWYETHPIVKEVLKEDTVEVALQHMVYDDKRQLWDRQRGNADEGTLAAGKAPDNGYRAILVDEQGRVTCSPEKH